jgi:hypothetical protein
VSHVLDGGLRVVVSRCHSGIKCAVGWLLIGLVLIVLFVCLGGDGGGGGGSFVYVVPCQEPLVLRCVCVVGVK